MSQVVSCKEKTLQTFLPKKKMHILLKMRCTIYGRNDEISAFLSYIVCMHIIYMHLTFSYLLYLYIILQSYNIKYIYIYNKDLRGCKMGCKMQKVVR